MPTAARKPTESLTVDLPKTEADFIRDLVASGRFPSAAAALEAGLQALRDADASPHDGDPEFERFLVEEVGPTYDAMMADPSRLKSIDEALREFEAYVEARTKAGD